MQDTYAEGATEAVSEVMRFTVRREQLGDNEVRWAVWDNVKVYRFGGLPMVNRLCGLYKTEDEAKESAAIYNELTGPIELADLSP